MKFLCLVIFGLLSTMAIAQSKIILAPVNHLYVPAGFDSNDTVEVIVAGEFPNACYSRNEVSVQITGSNVYIKISAIAPGLRLLTESACPQMVVPYKEVISLGNLQGGKYSLFVNKDAQSSLEEELNIAEASSNSVDDNIYAAVDWVEKKSTDEVILHGYRYSDCLALSKIKIVSNDKDTLSILPIMKQVREFCPMKGMAVSYPVKIDSKILKMNKPLLHVRTMDGKSVNTVINLEER